MLKETPTALQPVLFADEHLMVLNKPAGLLSVPGRGPDKQDCVLSRLQSSHPKALVVHRLDMATSGLMVFTLHADSQRQLSMMFAARDIEKNTALGCMEDCQLTTRGTPSTSH